jgi:uncharacterized protein (TIGR00304 family)
MSDQLLWSIGLSLVFTGFAVAFIAVLLVFLRGIGRKGKEGRVRGGGVIIIGPIPIIFGTDKKSVMVLMILSIILVVLMFIWGVILHRVFQ